MLNEHIGHLDAQQVFNMIYPVGSIYMSVNSTSPSILFGGTWEQIEDTFLLTAGSTYTAGDTGGSATHTPEGSVEDHVLTTTEVPAHTHTRGTMNITGSVQAVDRNYFWGAGTDATGAFTNINHTASHIGADAWTGTRGNGFEFNAANTWTGETSSSGGGGAHSHGFTGTSQDTMPPYLAVYCWKRTA